MSLREALARAAASVRLRASAALDDLARARLLRSDLVTHDEPSPEVGVSFHENDGGELGLKVTLVDEHEVERHGFVFLSRDMWDALECCAPWGIDLRNELDQLRERVGDPDKVAHHLYQIGATRGSLETRAETARGIYEAHLMDDPTCDEAGAVALLVGAGHTVQWIGEAIHFEVIHADDGGASVWLDGPGEWVDYDDRLEAARAYLTAVERAREGRG